MIRRDDDGHWLLIPQPEHVRIAAELADGWGNAEVAPLPEPELLVSAIRHHDDGWREWEAAPKIDPETGRPRNFTEMPATDATAIWSRSIESSYRGEGASSPLGGIWVSRHFTWLAEQGRDSRRGDAFELAVIEAFLEDQSEKQARWRKETAERFPPDDLDPLIETDFRWVQFFDRLSLWLCCAERTEPEEFSIPGGGTLRFVPQEQRTFRIEPWPLRGESLSLSVPAVRIPARRYRT
ncbi:MAG: DUF3891 family protein, partial [Planctomycetaceae bacterium]